MNMKNRTGFATLAVWAIVLFGLCLSLLSISALPAGAAPAHPTKTPRPTKTSTSAPSPTAVPISTPQPTADMPDSSLFLDAAWYRAHMLQSAERWNGGLDGQSGFWTYRSTFDGLFRINLDRQFATQSMSYSTAVAQSRAIYMNVEAYRAAADNAHFLAAVQKGADYLLAHFLDTTYGGFYWEVAPGGSVVDSSKNGYGNVHPLFALSQAYSVTGDTRYLKAAHNQYVVLKQHFLDPGPTYRGAVRPGFNRSFTQIQGYNNVDVFTHMFEALLSYYDVASDPAEKTEVGQWITTCGDFLVRQLYRDQAEHADRGYVAYNYDDQWNPRQDAYTRDTQWTTARQASTGHGVELAYLVSRAVERGLKSGANLDWLGTAGKLLTFVEAYALDPSYHAMLYEITDYDGTPLAGNPDNSYWLWWPQAETARAFLHFAVVRGRNNAACTFKHEENFFHRYQTDQQYRGLWERVKPDTQGMPAPDLFNKGHIWKTNYHYSMFFTEALRLSQQYPAAVAALAGITCP